MVTELRTQPFVRGHIARWTVRCVSLAVVLVLILWVVRGERRRIALRTLDFNGKRTPTIKEIGKAAVQSLSEGSGVRDLIRPYCAVTELFLHGDVTDVMAAALHQFPEVETLTVDYATDTTCAQIASALPNLGFVELFECDVTDIGITSLGRLPKLRFLSIVNSESKRVLGTFLNEPSDGYTGLGFNSWPQPHPLERLELWTSRRFDDAGMEILSRFPKLQTLVMIPCNISWSWQDSRPREAWPYFDPPVFPALEELVTTKSFNDVEFQIEFLRVQPKLKYVDPEDLLEKLRNTPPRPVEEIHDE